MKKKLLNKMEPFCSYCQHGKRDWNEDTVLCTYHGIVSPGESCRRFQYDPIKRVPNPKAVLPDYSFEDFEL